MRGKDQHPPLDPATIDDPILRAAAERFVNGEIDKHENRGRRNVRYDGKRDYVSSDGKRSRSRRHRHGGGVKRRGRLGGGGMVA